MTQQTIVLPPETVLTTKPSWHRLQDQDGHCVLAEWVPHPNSHWLIWGRIRLSSLNITHMGYKYLDQVEV